MNVASTRQAACIALAPSLVGKLVKRGRKRYWVAYTHCTGSVQLLSCNGAYKSFPLLADKVAPLVVRDAQAADMDPSHRGAAHVMLGTFLAQSWHAPAKVAQNILAA